MRNKYDVVMCNDDHLNVVIFCIKTKIAVQELPHQPQISVSINAPKSSVKSL